MKKVLFLGGAPTQIPPIKYALEQDYHVITLNYLPENPGHKLAHQYYNVSTTDKEAVLEVARAEKIDGIDAYASDQAVPTAAYVAEKMGLPGNPAERHPSQHGDYSLIETARANGFLPYEHLQHAFETLPTLNGDELTTLLPWQWKETLLV